LEFVARNAARYGGVAAFTGGLTGDKIDTENYKGDFINTSVFICTSEGNPFPAYE
jgi:phospholipase/carboxylesterase